MSFSNSPLTLEPGSEYSNYQISTVRLEDLNTTSLTEKDLKVLTKLDVWPTSTLLEYKEA